MRRAGIDAAADEAISNWSETDDHQDCRREELVPAHLAAGTRLPGLGAVSVNPEWVPSAAARRVSLPGRSLGPMDEGVQASVSGMLKVNQKRSQTGK